MNWTAERVAAVLARQVFNRELVCPNCTWTGYEADLLVVHGSLRLIDVEIKVSRADLCIDIDKQKWWQTPVWARTRKDVEPVRRDWPPEVWKHYYAMPAEMWSADLLGRIPAVSGVLLIEKPERVHSRQLEFAVSSPRRAKPNRCAPQINATDAVNIARLAGLRYWDVLAGKENKWTRAA